MKVYYCACGAGPFRLSRANAGAKGVCCFNCAFTATPPASEGAETETR